MLLHISDDACFIKIKKKKKKEPDRISKLLSILVENIRIKFGFVFNQVRIVANTYYKTYFTL